MIHNLYSFHGADHKVGTTMTAQSVAETISFYHPNLKILLAAMNGRESSEYVRELPVSIDSMKFHIDNRMIDADDFLKTCTHKGNFYIMAGISNEAEARYYHPDMAGYLLEEVAPEFDLVITDAGNELDNGLTVGALSLSEEVFLIVTQQESALRRYEKNRKLLEDLGVGVAAFIINKYYEQDPYGLSYLSDRLETGKEKLYKVDSAGWSRQAEIEGKTLLEYKNETYILDIIVLANLILNKTGFAEIRRQRKSRWKSFI
jgi:cellulose biosynthesis protein BcsQ